MSDSLKFAIRIARNVHILAGMSKDIRRGICIFILRKDEDEWRDFFIVLCARERRISCEIHKTDVARIKGRRFVLAYFRQRSTKKSARGKVAPNGSESMTAAL